MTSVKNWLTNFQFQYNMEQEINASIIEMTYESSTDRQLTN
jgi:hypothetical protein